MFGLRSDVKEVRGIGPRRASVLKRIGIETVYDFLTYFPRAYEDRSRQQQIASLHADTQATISGYIENIQEKKVRRNLTILEALVSDGTGYVRISWFNQKFLKPKLAVGKKIFAMGRLSYAFGGRGQLAMKSPTSFQVIDGDDEGAKDFLGIYPVYLLAGNLKQSFFRTVMKEILDAVELGETISAGIRESHHLLKRQEAFRAIHFPENEEELERARHTLAFEELYLIQCGLLLLKQKAVKSSSGICHKADGELMARFQKELPFQLTADQQTVWEEIRADMERKVPMHRLLQGDVGSGKTVVAMLALVKTVENGFQGALMAPTEILARQHYEGFQKQLAPLGIRVTFLSGRLTAKQKREAYARIAAHEEDIVIGTHALLEEDVRFARLGLVVTDEQHRFGIAQRAALEKKGAETPDVLVMTATPIPRTMMLTVYGDLDISTIRHLPPGRKPVRTFLRGPERHALIYAYVRKSIEAGGQAYVVCPLVEYSEKSDIPSAEEVYETLRHGIFQGIPCGLVHGRMKAADKEAVMDAFYEGKVKLLVATTVIEVGVNVPEANIMVIENAERFGLSQLHQLRGRVGRGAKHSDCILVSTAKSETAKARLDIMTQTTDGFRLAEEDLKLRGPGQFFGHMQHGMSNLKIADVLGDMDILLQARDAAIETLRHEDDTRFVLPILAMQYQKQFSHIMEV